MKKRKMRRLGLWIMLACLTALPVRGEELFREDFESYGDGASFADQKLWRVFRHADAPEHAVRPGVGVEGSKALAMWNEKGFRSDYMGLSRKLPEPLDGVFWIRCKFKAPKEKWTGGFVVKTPFVQASAGLRAPNKKAGETDPKVSVVVPYHQGYRAYRRLAVRPDHWYLAVLRVDLNKRTRSAWFDGHRMLENLRLETDAKALDAIYLCAGGTKDDPAYIDDLVVTREPPEGYVVRPDFPPKKEGLLFRFAAVADPQLGFHRYPFDLWTLETAVDQINASGADLTLFMGDLVHDGKDENAYLDFKKRADALDKPWYTVRGNHDKPEFFTKHIHKKLNYSFEHDGFRFVMFDATGQSTPMPEEQLAWIESEFKQAKAKGQILVICSHCSPWDQHAKGGKYNMIGPGKDKLKALAAQYGVLISLAGHLHRACWHHEEKGTHYFVPPGTSMIKAGPTGFALFDVYPDRVEVAVKQVLAAYDDEKTDTFFDLPYTVWRSYPAYVKRYPYLMQGPLTISREP